MLLTSQGPASSPSTVLAPGPIAHAHRWRIAEQSGPNSAGSCLCGETRDFANGFDDGPAGWMAHRLPGRGVLR